MARRSCTPVMSKLQQLLGFLPLDTTALLRTQLEQVTLISILRMNARLKRGQVRIWDTVGEDQTLKGEYKVITGRVYVTVAFICEYAVSNSLPVKKGS